MKSMVQNRTTVAAALAAAAGTVLTIQHPFPDGNALLQLVLVQKPYLFYAAKYAYLAMLFSSPFIVFSVLLSLAYIFVLRQAPRTVLAKLPLYPAPAGRERLYVVVGEIHHPKKPEPAEHPRWLTIPERGLFTGFMIFGAIGSGKTSGCMYPFAEQILAYRAQERDKRVGGALSRGQRRLLL
jgi:hypothetical protein